MALRPSLERGRAVVGHPALELICRLGLAAIFLYAGLPKAIEPIPFLLAVRNYIILPDVVIPSFTLLLPMVEIVAGALLLLGVWVRPSALIVGGMVVMFLVAIVSAIARGIDIDCGCFASGESHVGIELILRDIGMFAMLLPLFLARRRWLALRP